MERVMFSSEDTQWETPDSLFKELNSTFNFYMDVCAIEKNKKLDRYISPEQDGLTTPWKGTCWMNPPYTRRQHLWVEKAIKEVKCGNCDTVVILIPARTETVAWQEHIFPNATAISFIRGRLKFNNMSSGAPFPSALVVIGRVTDNQLRVLQKYGRLIKGDRYVGIN